MATRKFAAAGVPMTQVPTAFLADEMPDAPSDYVKVYLYGLYLASQDAEAHDAEIETSLHMKSSEIDEAFRYWQARGRVRILADNTVEYGSQASQERTEPYPYVAFNLRIADILGRTPSAHDLMRMYAWLEEYGFPQEVVLLLVDHCVTAKGKRVSLNYMEKLAQAWAEEGVNSVASAQEAINEYKRKNGGARQVMRQMGIFDRAPGTTEFALYEKWTSQWGFTHEGIVQAMTGREFNMSAPFKYLDAILRDYYEQGHVTAQAIAKESSARNSERDRVKELVQTLGFKGTGQRREYEDAYRKWKEWGFPYSVMKLACAQASHASKGRLERASEILNEWKDKGLRTEIDVRAHLEAEQAQDELVEEMIQELEMGRTRSIRDSDRRLYRQYTETYGMDHDVLLYAASMSSVGEEPDQYLRGVLRHWAEEQVHTLDEARVAAAEYSQQKAGNTSDQSLTYAQRLPQLDTEQRNINALRALEEKYGR